MGLVKSWFIWPLAIGLLALILIFALTPVASAVMASNARLADLVDDYVVIMYVLIISVLMFTAGMASKLLSRRKGSKNPGWLPVLITAAVPAIMIDVYMYITWIDSVNLYMSGGTLDDRPFETAIFPMMLLLMVIATILCLVPALAGGWLADYKNRAAEK